MTASLIRAAESVPALEAVQSSVDALLDAFLAERIADLAELDPALAPIGREVAELVRAGGKRLRPAFVYWGYRATGAPHLDQVMAPAAAVELLHTFALIHDDVMDRSAERRGRPAVHESLAAAHARDHLEGDAAWFGIGGAILAGDLAFVWADQLLDNAQLSPDAIVRARPVFTELRVEVMAGQYLDLRLAGVAGASEADALHVALLKSGRYTVTRPLQLGAALGGPDEQLDKVLCAFGDAVGVAFQLRDDVLGLFGEPSATGKGALEDLRDGKRTVLMLRALEMASSAGREVLLSALGDPQLDEAGGDRVREIVAGCGALAAVEELVASRQQSAREALAPLEQPARSALEELADLAAFRVV
ncbi:MAG TPA: polyprenyl synthetase family protein [Egibacteraceae bacterium]|nr:polyprenyl synthetase family protein [Egibacteraceae bacterium]